MSLCLKKSHLKGTAGAEQINDDLLEHSENHATTRTQNYENLGPISIYVKHKIPPGTEQNTDGLPMTHTNSCTTFVPISIVCKTQNVRDIRITNYRRKRAAALRVPTGLTSSVAKIAVGNRT